MRIQDMKLNALGLSFLCEAQKKKKIKMRDLDVFVFLTCFSKPMWIKDLKINSLGFIVSIRI